jgi:hypothetical protein
MTKQFIKVKATPCNNQGTTDQRMSSIELQINVDLIGAISSTKVLLKGGNILSIGGSYYTNLKIVDKIE